MSTLNTLFVVDIAFNPKEWFLVIETSINPFMVFQLLLIHHFLFKICIIFIFDFIGIRANINIESFKALESVLTIFFFKINNKINMNKGTLSSPNNSKRPNFFKYIKYLLISIFLFCTLDLNLIIQFIKELTFKKVFYVNIYVVILYIIYLCIELYIFILCYKGKMTIPEYLPLFLWNWLNHIKTISSYEPQEVRIFMDLYVRNLIVNVIGLFVLILVYNNI